MMAPLPRIFLPRSPDRTGRLGIHCLLVVLAVGLAPLTVSSQIRPGKQPSGGLLKTNSGAIEGRIVAGDDGSPVKSARVILLHYNGSEIGQSQTDDNGEFGFYNLVEGHYRVSVVHPDYAEGGDWVDLYGESIRDLRISLRAKEAKENAPVAMAPTVGSWALNIPEKAAQEYQAGLKALQDGKDKESIRRLQAAIELYPQYAAAHSALGAAYLRGNQGEAAAQAFQQALEIDANLPDANLGLGALFRAQKRLAEAEKLLLRARRAKPDDWRVHYELGQVYNDAGVWAHSEQSLRRALELHPELPRIHLLLVNALALQEKYPETLVAMEAYLERFPQDSFAEQVRRKRDLLKAELAKTSTDAGQRKP